MYCSLTTGTFQNKKQCDIILKYWSVKKGEVVVQFLKALFFKHAFGNDVAQHILQTLQEDEYQIPLSKFLNIGWDGPNVNKTIWSYLNDETVRMRFPGLMQFIPCNMHVARNAFKEGLSAYGSQVEELAIDLFYYFRYFPCRRDDFAKAQENVGFSEQMFIRHIECRWLTLILAVARVEALIFRDHGFSAKTLITSKKHILFCNGLSSVILKIEIVDT